VDLDLIVSGQVTTLAGRSGLGTVEAIGISGGRVAAAGSLRDVDDLAGPATRRLRLAPDLIALPGLTDAHMHLADAALVATQVDLTDVQTLEDGLRRIAAAHLAQRDEDAWLEGHGWDAERWGGWPEGADLQRAAPGRKAAFWAHDHHAMWASAAALAAAGVGAGTADPAGGVIRRTADGDPAGTLHEAATSLVSAIVPRAASDAIEAAVERFIPGVRARGVIAIHDPGEIKADATLDGGFAAYRRLASQGRLGLRVHACVRQEALALALDREVRSGQLLGPDPLARAHVGWLKLFADGTVGSRTGAMLEPFDPEPDRPSPPGGPLGLFVTPPELLRDLAAQAGGAGIATTIHAIGDAAVRVALDALAPTVGLSALVPRVEHVQLADPADVGRFRALGVAASMQPIHFHSDYPSARRAWGARLFTRAYPWWPLARAGALMPFGTDAPVEPIDPWPGIVMAMTPRPVQLPGEERPRMRSLGLGRVLRSACLDPAISAGERDRGRLVHGHCADVVVVRRSDLDRRLEPGQGRPDVQPQLVLLDGEEVFSA
jgi:predicted amidohydrolase YtcJ